MQKDFVIKAKHAVKRVAAISAGATLMGATMMGAVAADLGDYPAPFVSDGELNGLVVVGAGADAADIVGAVDIVSTLTQATVTGSSATTVTEGGEDAEVVLDGNLNSGFSSLDDNDLHGLFDGTIEWNDSEIDVHEEVDTTTSFVILSSGESSGEDKMGATPYLGTTGSSAFVYKYVIEENINTANQHLLNGVDSDNELHVTLLGNAVEITDMAAGAFTYKLAKEYSLFVGESVTVEGKTVSLVNVAEGASANVVVTVDGQQETVGTSSEDVNGIDIEVSETFYSDNLNERFAVIRAGSDISKTATDGDAVEMFGGDDTDSKNEWQWTIDLDETSNSYIGIEYDAVSDEIDDTWAPLALGDSLSFPNNYVTVKLDSLTSAEYTTIEFNAGGTESIEIGGTDSTRAVVEITSSTDDGLYINSTEVDTVFLTINTTANGEWDYHYQDDDGDWHEIDGSSGDESLNIQYDSGNYADVNMTNDSDGTLTATIQLQDISGLSDNAVVVFQKAGTGNTDKISIGAAEDEAAADVAVGGTNYGTREYDVLFDGGTILRDPDSNLQGWGSVIIEVPSEEIKANVVMTGPDSSTTTMEYSSVTVNSVAGMDVVKLDSEVTDAAAKNLILVGGPAVNSLTAEAMGLSFPTYGADSGIPEGAALLKSIDNAFGGSNSALVVAGWSSDDTRNAARYLQAYNSNSLSGDSMTVTGPSTATSGGEATAE